MKRQERQMADIGEFGSKTIQKSFSTPESQVRNRNHPSSTQRALLEAKYPSGEFISDIASGFNQDRRGYKRILELALNKTPLHVVATTSDRITRSGFSLIKWIVELHGGRIELLEEKNNPEQFDTTTLIAFITSFINSHYGKRSAKRRQEKAISKDDC